MRINKELDQIFQSNGFSAHVSQERNDYFVDFSIYTPCGEEREEKLCIGKSLEEHNIYDAVSEYQSRFNPEIEYLERKDEIGEQGYPQTSEELKADIEWYKTKIDALLDSLEKAYESTKTLSGDFFVIKDYLLDNDVGYNSETISYKETFNGVNTDSIDTVMESLIRVELELNNETVEWVSSSESFNFDFENNWYSLYANCTNDGMNFNAVGILQETNKAHGTVIEHSVGFTNVELDSLRQSCEKTIGEDLETYKEQQENEREDR